MKIAIIGYGKLGRMIESIALEKGHTIGSRIDIDNQELLEPDSLGKHDVAIEFTRPETARANITKCLDAGIPVVSGTTGWISELPPIIDRCRKENGSFLYASNFSLGVNILFHLNKKLAAIMNNYDQYDIRMQEVHHTQKLDAPSGTALTLAEGILEEIDRKKKWVLSENPDRARNEIKDDVHPRQDGTKDEGGTVDADGTTDTNAAADPDGDGNSGIADSDELVIEALREGMVPGIHELTYESEFDEISISHSAKDRRGFALGAVLAAEFIQDKKGFFTMKDVLKF